jgi:hypothetical protein
MERAMQARAGSAPHSAYDQAEGTPAVLPIDDHDPRRPIRAMSENSPYARPVRGNSDDRRLTRRRTPKEALEILEATFAQ